MMNDLNRENHHYLDLLRLSQFTKKRSKINQTTSLTTRLATSDKNNPIRLIPLPSQSLLLRLLLVLLCFRVSQVLTSLTSLIPGRATLRNEMRSTHSKPQQETPSPSLSLLTFSPTLYPLSLLSKDTSSTSPECKIVLSLKYPISLTTHSLPTILFSSRNLPFSPTPLVSLPLTSLSQCLSLVTSSTSLALRPLSILPSLKVEVILTHNLKTQGWR